MRVVFALSRMSGKVADAWLFALCTFLQDKGHEPAIVSRSELRHAPEFYGVPLNVPLFDAGEDGAAGCLWHDATCWRRRLGAWKKALLHHTPDIVVACDLLANLQTLLTLRDSGIPIVVMEQSDPLAPPALAPTATVANNQGELPLRFKLMRRTLYLKAARVVMRTEAAQQWGASLTPPWKTQYIPGFIEAPPPPEDHPPESWLSKPCIVAMGDLIEENEYPTLLHAFAHCAGDYPEWAMFIIGKGPEQGSLEALLTFLQTQGLKDRVLLLPPQENPWTVLHHADVFAMSGALDIFPKELCQAMACGVPGLAFDHSWGGGSVITHGEDGLLAPADNPQAFAEVMRRMLADQALRRRLSRNAPLVLEHFGKDAVLTQWGHLLEGLAKQKK